MVTEWKNPTFAQIFCKLGNIHFRDNLIRLSNPDSKCILCLYTGYMVQSLSMYGRITFPWSFTIFAGLYAKPVTFTRREPKPRSLKSKFSNQDEMHR